METLKCTPEMFVIAKPRTWCLCGFWGKAAAFKWCVASLWTPCESPLPLGWCELQAFSSCIFLDDVLVVLHRPYFERGAVMQLHRVRCKINEPAGRMLLDSLLGAVYQSPALPHIHPHHHQPSVVVRAQSTHWNHRRVANSPDNPNAWGARRWVKTFYFRVLPLAFLQPDKGSRQLKASYRI